MEYGAENVCLSLDESKSLLAVGSRAHVTLLDPRLRNSPGTRLCRTLCSPDGGNGEEDDKALPFSTLPSRSVFDGVCNLCLKVCA